MRIISLAAVLLCSLALSAFFYNSNNSAENYITFHADKEAIGAGSPGHLYIEFNKKNKDLGTFGYYPKGDYKKAQFLAGVEVEGKLEDDSGRQSDYSYKVVLKDHLFNQAWQIKRDWKNSSRVYKGGEQDCISFGLEVAEAAGLNTGNRNELGTFPLEIVKSIASKN